MRSMSRLKPMILTANGQMPMPANSPERAGSRLNSSAHVPMRNMRAMKPNAVVTRAVKQPQNKMGFSERSIEGIASVEGADMNCSRDVLHRGKTESLCERGAGVNRHSAISAQLAVAALCQSFTITKAARTWRQDTDLADLNSAEASARSESCRHVNFRKRRSLANLHLPGHRNLHGHPHDRLRVRSLYLARSAQPALSLLGAHPGAAGQYPHRHRAGIAPAAFARQDRHRPRRPLHPRP